MIIPRVPREDIHKDDVTLFREMVEIIFKAPEWKRWNQAPGAGIEFNAANFKIKGLLRIHRGEREWWLYPVDRQRLRTEGPEAIARAFLEGYTQARN